MVWIQQGSGCDKRFFVEMTNATNLFGAIICTQQVADRERAAHGRLSILGLSVIPEIRDWTAPGGLALADGTESERPRYMIQRIIPGPGQDRLRTFKPMMTIQEVTMPIKRELRRGNKQRMLLGINSLLEQLHVVCNAVGELTLAVDHATGGLYMLDFSPNERGETATINIDGIRKGLNNIRNFILMLP